MRLVSRILAGLTVPAVIAGIAALALVGMTAECPRLVPADSPAEGRDAGWEPELIYSPELGIRSVERHPRHRREVKAPIAEVLRCPLALVGVHSMKDQPGIARAVYYFCKPINDDVSQCILYDGTGPDARLIGIEYLVTEEVHSNMPPHERAYWNDHKYEVDSGLLKSLTQSGEEEAATLVKVRTLWGKGYHTWVSGQDYPQGPARPFWSVTGKEPFILPHDARLPPELEGTRLAPCDERSSGSPGEGSLEDWSKDRDGAGIDR